MSGQLIMVERRSLFRAPSSPDRDPEVKMSMRPRWGFVVIAWAICNGIVLLGSAVQAWRSW